MHNLKETEPVWFNAAYVSAIWALAYACLRWAGIDVPDDVNLAVVPAALALAAMLTRGKVTPLAAPKDADGNPLNPFKIGGGS